MTRRRLHSAALAAAFALAAAPQAIPLANAVEHRVLDIRSGHVVMELVGQVNNFPATAAAPFGSSQQFGYVASLEGVDDLFTDANPASQNAATAKLTFVIDVVTTRVTPHGPFTIINREGTMTFYRNRAPADFTNPASFQSGDAAMTSTIRQQVILDTVERTFTVVNVNTIDTTTPIDLDSAEVRIGSRGDMFRTSLMGVLRVRDGVPPPTGHFAGFAVGIARATHDRD